MLHGDFMAGHNKTKTAPFRLLVSLLYGRYEWVERLDTGVVRLHTGPATQTLRLRSARLWEYLYWLEKIKLVERIEKEPKRGTVIVHLSLPTVYREVAGE